MKKNPTVSTIKNKMCADWMGPDPLCLQPYTDQDWYCCRKATYYQKKNCAFPQLANSCPKPNAAGQNPCDWQKCCPLGFTNNLHGADSAAGICGTDNSTDQTSEGWGNPVESCEHAGGTFASDSTSNAATCTNTGFGHQTTSGTGGPQCNAELTTGHKPCEQSWTDPITHRAYAGKCSTYSTLATYQAPQGRKPWCVTDSATGEFGYCNGGCEKACSATNGTNEWQTNFECTFPFKYTTNGFTKNYNKCITYDNTGPGKSGKAWCYTGTPCMWNGGLCYASWTDQHSDAAADACITMTTQLECEGAVKNKYWGECDDSCPVEATLAPTPPSSV